LAKDAKNSKVRPKRRIFEYGLYVTVVLYSFEPVTWGLLPKKRHSSKNRRVKRGGFGCAEKMLK